MNNNQAALNNQKDTFTRKTFCRICLACCGLEVETDGEQILSIKPDKDNAYNWRDFCLKGGSAHKLREHPDRLTTPMKRVGDNYVAVSYEQAINEIAAQLKQIRDDHGANAIATYIGNPGMASMPSSIFQGGFTAGVGTKNCYTVGSVDQNGFLVVAGAMYGSELAVLVPDIDHSDCMLLLGMNPAVSYFGWMYTSPNGWNRVLEAQEKGADVIMVDPRVTPSTKKAKTHIQVRPGEDWAFLLGIIKVVFENGWENEADCKEANGVDTLRAITKRTSLDELAQRCRVPAEKIIDVARRFATAKTAVCVANTGVAHNRNGTIGEWLSHVLNLITGRTDRKGGRYYQQGIFKNTLKFLNKMAPPVERRSRIGGYKAVTGAYPLAILPDEITTPGDDQIRALIIHAGNPVVSGPDGKRLDAALQKLDLLIGIDYFQRESHSHAHWLIPAAHMLEREEFYGIFITGLLDKPFVQLSEAVIEPREGIMPEWEFFRELTLAMKVPFMGIPGLNYLIRGSKWLAQITANKRMEFNPRWFFAFIIKAFSKLKWKDLVNNPSGYFFEDTESSYGHFRACIQTPDGLIQAAPPEFVDILQQRLAAPVAEESDDYPLQLVNERHLSMMNSWLVETVKRNKVLGDFVDINPQDAADRNIIDDQRVHITSATASIEARARITDEVPSGIVSMPHGWGSRVFDPQGNKDAQVQGCNRNLLVAATDIDELSGIPNLNGTRVDILPL